MKTEAQQPQRIDFEPIPCPGGKGLIHLSIYPPGSSFGNREFTVFVGGCRVDDALTLSGAKAKLLDRALERLRRYQVEAETVAVHYRQQAVTLAETGLVPKGNR